MKNNKLKKMMASALVFTMIASMTACGEKPASTASGEKNSDAAGTILLSVNPEIEVEYDNHGIVLEVEGSNDDGKSVVSEYKNFQGRKVAEVVEELVEEIYEDGYFENQIDGHAKNIVIKLEDGSVCPNDDFLNEVAEGVRSAVNGFNGTSAAMVVDDDDLDDQGRIGIEKARELVLAQLGIDNAAFSEGEYDLDDNVYELEFTAGGVEYEYEVDAVTGKVLEADREHNDDWDAWDDDDDDDDDRDDADDDDDRDDADDDDRDDTDDDDRDDIDDKDDRDDIDDADDRDDIDDKDDRDDTDDADDRDDTDDADDRDDTDDDDDRDDIDDDDDQDDIDD